MNTTTVIRGRTSSPFEASPRDHTERAVRTCIRIALLLVIAALAMMLIPNAANASTVSDTIGIEKAMAVPAVEKVDVGKERTVISLANAEPVAIEYGDVLDPEKPGGLLGLGALAGVGLGLMRRVLHAVMTILRIAR